MRGRFTDRMRGRQARRVVWQGTVRGRERSARLAERAAPSPSVRSCEAASGRRWFVAGQSGFTEWELANTPWTF